MKKIINGWQLLSLLLVMLFTFTFTACEKGREVQEDNSGQGGAKGRYVEKQVPFDKGGILSFRGLEDGKIRLLSDTGIFDSSDQGESWEEWKSTPQEMRSDIESGMVNSAVISGKGSVFYSAGQTYKLMMPDGNIKPVLLEEFLQGSDKEQGMIWGGEFTDSGDFLCMGREKIYQLDIQSMEVKHIYGEESQDSEYIGDKSFCTAGDKLYITDSRMEVRSNGTPKLTDVNIESFDLTTFESLGRQEILEQFVKEGAGNSYGFTMIPEQNGKALYLIGQDGIYRWQIDGTAIEKIFNGQLGQMMSESVLGGAAFGENSLMLLYPDSESDRPYDHPMLFKYIYDPDAALQPEKTLTIYSMYEDYRIRQAIAAYRKTNTDVAVAYEVGMTGEDGMTRTDALKILNTNIMAGKGPDIMMLEGMPIDSYLDKGILMDISDVVEEVDSSDGILMNIADAYKKGEFIGAVPTYFAVPLIYGKESLLAQAADLEGLVSVTEAQRAAYPEAKDILGDITPVSMLKFLTSTSSPAWISQDGTIDKEKLIQFLHGAKRIVDAQGNIDTEFIGELEDDSTALDMAPFMSSVAYIANSMGFSDAQLSLGNLKGNTGMMQMVSMMRKMGDSGFDKAGGQAGNVFIPLKTFGVSAKSGDPNTAKEFIRYLLTGGQTISGEGWPVNEAVFDKAQEKPESVRLGVINPVNDMDGSSYELEWVWPSKEDFQKLKTIIGTLDTPAVTDEMINRSVMQEGMKCLRGELTVDEAAEAIVSGVNLYLAE
ncbi:MAG: extracellular solute-binding protein [Eubacteriales bacterium]|nr:extracellular solute-binding protein [Eubacteriales bacterium]